MFPKVVQVIPMKDYSVYVYFEDGKIVNYDMSKMIEKEAFCCLKEIEIFLDRCTVMNDTLAWDISEIGMIQPVSILIRIHYMHCHMRRKPLHSVRSMWPDGM